MSMLVGLREGGPKLENQEDATQEQRSLVAGAGLVGMPFVSSCLMLSHDLSMILEGVASCLCLCLLNGLESRWLGHLSVPTRVSARPLRTCAGISDVSSKMAKPGQKVYKPELNRNEDRPSCTGRERDRR